MGKAKSSRGDYTASEDDNVLVQGVSSDKGALGFFGLGYYAENKSKLKLVGVDAGKGIVFPTDSTVRTGVYAPLSRPEFIYVNSKSAKNPVVQEFVKFYLENASYLVKEVGYVPLPDAVYVYTAQALHRVLMIILRKLSWAKPNHQGAIIRPVRMTMFWYREYLQIKERWDFLD